jgi:hypothetical protein
MEQGPTIAPVLDAERRIAIAIAVQGARTTAHIAAVGISLAAQDGRDFAGGRIAQYAERWLFPRASARINTGH